MAATHRRMLKIENLGENSLKWLPNRNGSSMEAWIRYKSPHMAAESRWQRRNEQIFQSSFIRFDQCVSFILDLKSMDTKIIVIR